MPRVEKQVSLTFPRKCRSEQVADTNAIRTDRRHRAEAEARRAVRNATLANAFPDWEKHILPNWRVVFHDDSQGRYLRRLWWNGTMPVRWRGRLWSLCIGNGLAMPKTAFTRASDRARHLLRDGALAEVEAAAKRDVERALPALKLFQEGRVMHDDLMELLLAWAVYEKRVPRYVRRSPSRFNLLFPRISLTDASPSLTG